MSPFNITTIKIGATGEGVLTAIVASPAELKSLVAHLSTMGIVFEGTRARYIALRKEPAPPSTYPAEVGLQVREETPEDAVTSRMMVSSAFVEPHGVWLRVVSFEPPIEGGTTGTLRAEFDSVEEYEEALRFLQESHGSAVRAHGQDLVYVFSIADDAHLSEPFPQKITFIVEWRFIPQQTR